MNADRSSVQPPLASQQPNVAAVVLAAGRSSRMGTINKLLIDVDGTAMVARVVDALLSSRVRPIIVVTGHQSDEVSEALAGREVELVYNEAYADGLSTSLRAGLSALTIPLSSQIDAVVICLGDMPWVCGRHIDALMDAFDPDQGREICVPTYGGRRGNPILWASRFFAQMSGLKGDSGARRLLREHAEAVCFVPVDDDGVIRDVDTTDDF